MDSNIPSPEDVRAALNGLNYCQVQRLSELSGVPFTTLWNMRGKADGDPRISTVHKFYPHVAAVREEANA